MAEDRAKFTTELNVEGAEETKAAVKGVGDETAKLTATTVKLEEGLEDQTHSQDEATASGEDYIAVLSRISPLLGGVVDAMRKGSKIAGDLASQNLKLGEASEGAAKFAAKHAKTITLLGAGGAAIAAVLFMISQIKAMGEEWEKVNAQIDSYNSKANTAKGVQIELREAIRDAALQQGKALSPEELDRATASAEAATRSLLVSRQAAAQAAADLTVAGQAVGTGDVTQRARAGEAGLVTPGGRVTTRSQRLVAEDIAAQQADVARQREAATREIEAGDPGGFGALSDLLTRQAEALGEKAPGEGLVEDLVTALRENDDLARLARGRDVDFDPLASADPQDLDFGVPRTTGAAIDELTRLIREQAEARGAEVSEAQVAALIATVLRLTGSQTPQAGSGAAQATVVHHNARVTVNTPSGQAGVRNGESARDGVGVG